jgi:predicted enzyme involved in methoxymalonyl-ACP biosynthesis
MVIVAHLVDRFGDSGLIGAMILQAADTRCLVESLMVSCRVDGRGIPSALLVLAMRLTQREGAPSLFVRFNATERNRRLALLYQMMGFRPMQTDDSLWSVDVVGEPLPQVPEWLAIAGTFPELRA